MGNRKGEKIKGEEKAKAGKRNIKEEEVFLTEERNEGRANSGMGLNNERKK